MTSRQPTLDPDIARMLKRDGAGLFPAVAQQHDSGEVLMVGWMDDEALRRTLTTGRVTYWSRSRAEYWVKGESSGHRQWVRSVALDCDGDTVLLQVDQEGPACHTGDRTCFDGHLLPAYVATPDERLAGAAAPSRPAPVRAARAGSRS
ncbi:MAG: phosphoribosyl-AMP cyclohydrolase [Frankia sp.]